jgi:hypothetical protein
VYIRPCLYGCVSVQADRMLDMGFEPDIRRIVAAIPHKEGVRQTVMFRCVLQPTCYDRPVPLFVFA